MDILLKWLIKVRDYLHGFLEIIRIETPRYSFIIEKFDITYHNASMKTKISYTPVGCYRLFKNFAFELNDEIVCRKFKPGHARMIIGIDTLEKTLDFTSKCSYMKKIIVMSALTLALQANLVNAGAWGPTAHSRANCGGFNESVTWHLGHSYWWRVESHHYPAGWSTPNHILNTGTAQTWRAAAYHATEAYSSRGDKWWVNGYHFYYPNGKERLDVMTSAGDCNIYDGWWDQ